MSNLKLDPNAVVSALAGVLPTGRATIGLHEPLFKGQEWAYVKECIDTGWVSSVGKYVDKFEQKLAEFTGVKRAIAVVNGTLALHVCLKLVDVQPGDEVLIPTLTFVATANAVVYCGAIPHLVDSESATLGVDPGKLADYLGDIAEMRGQECFNKKTGRRIRALVAMHTFGHPVDLDPIVELCAKFKLELIEDAAESLGTSYKGRHTGNWGRASSLSFNGNKIITTGGGGAILTNDEALGNLAKHLTTTAKEPHKWEFNHDQIGFNYRLPNINAALGCAQLEQLPGFIESKRALAEKYRVALAPLSGLKFFSEPVFARSNYWLNAIVLDEQYSSQRNDLLELAHMRGLLVRPAWTLMHRLPMFQNSPKMDLSTAESLQSRIINIPSSASLV